MFHYTCAAGRDDGRYQGVNHLAGVVKLSRPGDRDAEGWPNVLPKHFERNLLWTILGLDWSDCSARL